MHEAAARGFSYGDPTWANLGQGSPETGPLPGAPERLTQLTLSPARYSYGPTEGDRHLREKVAALYNHRYRQGRSSQYTYKNVSIAGGGRLALTRIAAALDNCNMGHFIPDYTAYEELLSSFRSFIPIPILLDGESGYKIPWGQLRQEIVGRGFNAVLISNPCNPTGQLAEGNELKTWVKLARECHCTFIVDEFYSHFIYTGSEGAMVSAAEYVEDVNTDPVVVVDGLTKNWRYPGLRLSWTVGPESVIEALASAGSFLDGGANHPFQELALDLLDPEYVLQEARAIQKCFQKKRDYLLERLPEMGIRMDADPEGAFYVWANVGALPKPLNSGLEFFKAGLDYNVITVPGVFFDVNPGRRRPNARYQSYVRISFGPPMESIVQGVDALEKMISDYS